MTPHKYEIADRIVKAATELYRAGGERRMTMRAIGRCVGMRASALYRHFPSKAALIEAVAAREIDVLMRRAYEENEKSKPPRNLIRVLDMMIKYTRREPHMFALLRDRPAPKGHSPAEIFQRACMRVAPKSPEFTDELCRKLWAAIVGPAAPHAFGAIHDLRFQTLRSLYTVCRTVPELWHAMRYVEGRFPQVPSGRPAILGPLGMA